MNIFANPQGGIVGTGDIQISQPNNSTLNIQQNTQKGIINWQSFNIQKGQTTQFTQPNSSAITLNRINGANGPSSIFGTLTANGQVWLMNSSGIVFGKSAQVNVGGLLATTSNIKDDDFLAGRYQFFSDTPNPGSIVNQGSIQVQQGGLVALIGNSVENRGLIQAKMGTVILGGARAYTLDFDGDQLINFKIQQGPSNTKSNTISNSGLINVGTGVVLRAHAGRKLVQNSINMSGISEANHVYTKGGVIILDAGGGGAKVSGHLLAKNGSVTIKAQHIKSKNTQIITSGGAEGGSINLLSTDGLSLINTQLSANGVNNGGTIKILGKNITLHNTRINADGNLAGGTVLIGGNTYGAGPEFNAHTTYIDSQTHISANSLISGQGGKIVIWADGATQVYGNLEAKGGLLGGNGGFIETSGGHLDIAKIKVSLAAPQGITGTWLLDPSDIVISNGATDMTYNSGVYTPNPPTASASILNVTDLTNQLAVANIQVVTTSTGAGSGNITIATPIIWNSANTLTLTADANTGQVLVNNAITANGTGAGLILSGNSISIAAPITTTNGNVRFTGATTISVNNAVSTGTGSQTYNSPVTLSAATNLIGGQITMGAVSLNANRLTITSSSPLSTISGVINGTGGITTAGTGILTLGNAANTYTGQTIISGGTLQAGTLANGGINSALGATIATTAILIGNGTLSYTGAAVSTDRRITLNGPGTIQSTANTLTLTGALANSGNMLTFDTNTGDITASGLITGTGGLTKIGAGILTLTNTTNSYAGQTIINNGTIRAASIANAGGNSSLGATPIAVPILIGSAAPATLSYTGGTVSTNRLITINGTGGGTIQSTANALTLTGTINNGGNMLTLDTNTGNISITSVISGSGGLTKTGSGILNLTSVNSYTGATLVSGGRLTINNVSGLGSGATQSSSTTVLSGAGILMSFSVGTLANTNPIVLSGTGIVGEGALTSSAATTTLNNSIILNANASIGGAGNLILNGVISDGGNNFSMTKTSTNTLIVTGTNTYGGGTEVDAGILNIQNTSGLGTTGAITVNGGTLNLSLGGNTLQNASTMTFNGGALTSNSAASSTNTLNNNIVLNTTTTLTTTTTNSVLSLTGTISGSGGLTKAGDGILSLSGVNSYTGANLINLGIINALNPSALGGATGGTITVATGATLGINTGGATLANQSTITLTGTALLIGNGAAAITDTLANPIILTSGSTPTIRSANADATLILSGAITNNTASLTFNSIGNTLVSGVLGNGSGNIIKTGTGILTLANANNYTGTTALNAGTIAVTNANALGGASAGVISLATGTTLNINLGGAALANTNTINLAGTATITDSTATGTTDILNNPIVLAAAASPTITATNAGAALTLNGAITNSTAAITFNNTGNILVSGVIGGSTGGLSKIGTGTLTLSNTNTYTGQTIIAGGTLQAATLANGGINSALGATIATTAILIGNGTLSYTGAAVSTDRRITLNGPGTIQSTANTLTLTGALANSGNMLTFDTNTGDIIASGLITGTGGLTKIGTGILTLTNTTNSYAGQTIINNGTIRAASLANAGGISSLGAAPIAVPILIGSTTPATLSYTGGAVSTNRLITINGTGGGTIQSTANTLTLTGTINNNGNVLTLDTNTGNISITNVISGSGGLTKTGSGILNLTSVNSYTGATLVSGGRLTINNVSGLGSGATQSSSTTVLSGAGILMSFSVGTLANTNPIILSGTGIVGEGALTSSAATTTLNNSIILNANASIGGAGNLILNGVISDGGNNFSMTKTSTNTLIVTGTNTYGGGTEVNAGILNIQNTSGLGSTGAIVINGGTLNLSLGGNTLQNSSTMTFNGGALTSNSAASTTNTLNNNLVLNTTTTLTTTTTNSVLSLTGTISGSGGLTKAGTGILTLANANNYTGTTALNAGTIAVTNANALGDASAGVISLATGTTLNINLGGAALANTNTINLAGTATITDSTATGTTDILNNPIVLAAAASPTITATNAGAALNLNGAITHGGRMLTFNTQAGDISASGAISGGGALTKAGTGTLTLGGLNTYTGATLVSAGALSLTNPNSLGLNATQSSSITILSGASLLMNFATGTLANTNRITLSGGGTDGEGALIGLAGTGTLNNLVTLNDNTTIGGTGNLVLNGVISDNGNNFSLTKAGTNTLTLSGTNTYAGGTIVNAGTLNVTNDFGLGTTGSLTVNNGILNFALGGNVLKNENTIIINNGTLSDSTAPGTTDVLMNDIQLYNTATIRTINNDATLVLNGTINGTADLTVEGDGNLTLSNTVGDSTPLNSVTISTHNTVMKGGYIRSTGAQTYNTIITLPNDLSLDTQTGAITFNGTVNGQANLILSSVSGDIHFNSPVGNLTRLHQLSITGAKNVTALAPINSYTFIQNMGSGISDYRGGLNTLSSIDINANSISGNFYASSATISLNGINSLTGNVFATDLIVTGQHGGTLFGTVTGSAALGANPNGIFTLNGVIIGANPNPPNPFNPLMPDFEFFNSFNVFGVLLNNIVPDSNEDLANLITFAEPKKHKMVTKKEYALTKILNEHLTQNSETAMKNLDTTLNLLTPIHLNNKDMHNNTLGKAKSLRIEPYAYSNNRANYLPFLSN